MAVQRCGPTWEANKCCGPGSAPHGNGPSSACLGSDAAGNDCSARHHIAVHVGTLETTPRESARDAAGRSASWRSAESRRVVAVRPKGGLHASNRAASAERRADGADELGWGGYVAPFHCLPSRISTTSARITKMRLFLVLVVLPRCWCGTSTPAVRCRTRDAEAHMDTWDRHDIGVRLFACRAGGLRMRVAARMRGDEQRSRWSVVCFAGPPTWTASRAVVTAKEPSKELWALAGSNDKWFRITPDLIHARPEGRSGDGEICTYLSARSNVPERSFLFCFAATDLMCANVWRRRARPFCL